MCQTVHEKIIPTPAYMKNGKSTIKISNKIKILIYGEKDEKTNFAA